MASVAGASSLFEIGFAVNAVFAVVVGTYTKQRASLYDIVLGQMREHGIEPTDVSRKYVYRFIDKAMNALKVLRFSFYVCMVLASLSALASVGLLLYGAIDDKATIPTFALVSYSAICILVNPLLYYGFYKGSVELHQVVAKGVNITLADAQGIMAGGATEEFFHDINRRMSKLIAGRQRRKYRQKVQVLSKWFGRKRKT